eukprot:c24663_g1_i5 orf=1007-1222(+)
MTCRTTLIFSATEITSYTTILNPASLHPENKFLHLNVFDIQILLSCQVCMQKLDHLLNICALKELTDMLKR